MRPSSDLPSRPRLRRPSGRAVLIALGVLFFLVVVFGRAIARFYVDYLWHEGLGREDVFWGVLWAKITLFAIFFLAFALIAGLNLYLADRVAPSSFPANVHPYVERFHELFGQRLRLVRYGTAAVLALLVALPAISRWQDWLLFRNSESFGIQDAQFGADVGFYVFELPFITFAVDWLFAAVIIVTLLTLAAHLLNGGILFTAAVPTVRPATKIHFAVLLAVLAVIKAADYWLARYELTNENRGVVQGATYAVVNAELPALMLLVLVALLTAGLFLSTIRTNRWRLPLVSSGLWFVVLVVGALIYPAVIQSLVVRPNQEEREAVYIERNVEATRQAMGIDDVEVVPIELGDRLTASEVEDDTEQFENVRLLNPGEIRSRFVFDRQQEAGLSIDDLDVDRYVLSEVDRTGDTDDDVEGIGEREQVLITARELDLATIANRSWQGQHLVNTRGCGLVMSPVSRVTGSRRPAYIDVELDRPELYFSPSISGFAIANTSVSERDCGENEPYTGDQGVQMSSFVRRAAFALAFLDYNVVGSGAVDGDSQMLWVRDVRDRVDKLAPFLTYDGDPYPVVVEGGVKWVIDAYTTTTRYPYGQRIGNVQLTNNSGLASAADANYLRNSVKAVVDAYTGEVTFYVSDDDDPILEAWRGAFPDLFTPLADMPDELQQHLRYPEDLFRVQTDLYSKYRIPAEDFFQREGAWSVAQAPSVGPRTGATAGTTAQSATQAVSTSDFATESDAARFVPYYTMFRQPDASEDFVILRPFVPFSSDDSRTELQAYMTASSDIDDFGRLRAYVVTDDDLPDGPIRVTSQAESEPELSQRISFDDNQESGSLVRFGDLQLVPVEDGVVWVRPYYVEIEEVTEFRFVIVSHNEDSAFAGTLDEALAELFPGFDGGVDDRVAGAVEEPVDEVPDEIDEEPVDDGGDETVTTRPPLADDAGAAELLAEAEALFIEADEALRAGDLGEYQTKVADARDLLIQALDLVES